jgi:2-polyprenyl-3-methyl-5-hydroxy-6-metoxy-1,4-benzoquinol methylase
MNSTMNENDIREALTKHNFYHIIKLTDNISTPGNPLYVSTQNLCMKYLKSLDLKGKRVLDIGCRDGLFSFAAESMGAAEVIGIDNDLSPAATEFLIPFFNSKVKMIQMNLYDLNPSDIGVFDVIVFPGVLYHLRYPFWGFKVIRDVLKVGGNLIVETPIWKGEHNNAMLFCPIGEASPYEPTSCTFFNEKGLVDTLKSIGFETLSIEYLDGSPREQVPPEDFVKRVKAGIKRFLSPQPKDNPPIKAVTRTVFHSRFNGYDKNSFIMQYWEDNHDFHTEIGEFGTKSPF